MAAKSEEALEKRRKYHREWHRAHASSPEQNKARYQAFKKKLEDPEFHEEFLRKRRERLRAKAAEKKAAETEAERQAKRQRQIDATIASNKARARQPKPQIPKLVKEPVTLARAREINKRKPGRIVALSGWKGW
jgi:hypothetical protein